MKKIHELKAWFSFSNAAKYLSGVFDDDVTEADIVQLALEHRLKVALRVTGNVYSRGWAIKKKSDIEWENFEFGGEDIKLPVGGSIYSPSRQEFDPLGLKTDECLQRDDSKKVYLLEDGLWKLPMIGAARLQLEDYFQSLSGGKPQEMVSLSGIYVQGFTDKYHELMMNFSDLSEGIKFKEPFATTHFRNAGNATKHQESLNNSSNFFPLNEFPHDDINAVVIRKEDMADFVKDCEEQASPNRSAVTKQQNSLMSIIQALLHGAKIDPTSRDAVAKIKHWSDSTESPVTEDTIKKYLKQIRNG